VNRPVDPSPAQLGELLATHDALPPQRAAEVYTTLGFPVVPLHAVQADGACTCPHGARCPDPGKHPCLAGWPQLASTSPATVRGWWRRWPAANVGLATGIQFDVLDVDGPQGQQELRALLEAGGVPRGGPLARTGRGWHLLLAPTGRGNRVGLRPGLDWRGRGGLIVAPPSRHASGQVYRWVRPPGGPLPRAPAALRRLLAGPRPAPSPPPQRARAGYGPAALAGEAAKVTAATPGRRQPTLNVAAFKLGRLVAAGLLTDTEVWAALTTAATRIGLGEAETAKTIGRALADATGHPRPATHGGRGW
jgi:hypothetical protein